MSRTRTKDIRLPESAKLSSDNSSKKNDICPKEEDYICKYPIDPAQFDIVLDRGSSFKLDICKAFDLAIEISCIYPGARAQIKFQRDHELVVGESISVYNHKPRARVNLNGIHKIEEIIDDRTITISRGYISSEVESYVRPPELDDCDEICVPTAVLMDSLANKRFEGWITSRPGGVDTYKGVRVAVSQGSDVLRIAPGIIHPGDIVTVFGAEINKSKVLKIQPDERGFDFATLDQYSSITSDCAALSSDVGALATFNFDYAQVDCGCLGVYLTPDQTLSIPLVGDNLQHCCEETYKIGSYAIYCYYDSVYGGEERIAFLRGCAYMNTPSDLIIENTEKLGSC